MSITHLLPEVGDPQLTDRELGNLRPFIQKISQSGLLDSGLSESGAAISESAAAIYEVASQCLASAFVTWSHRMTLEYVDRFGSAELKESYLPGLLAGDRVGSTALATALADRSGKELLPITFRRDGDEFVIDGVIPWASNLYSDTLVVFAAREPETGERALFATEVGFAGVALKPAEGLLALNATSSGTIRFNELRLGNSFYLTSNVNEFFARMRPRFLLLQTAFCLGLSSASLDASQLADGRLPFESDLYQLQGELNQLRAEWHRLLELQRNFAAISLDQDVLPYLKLRLRAAVLAQAATRVELAAVGGRGYFVSHPTSRRIRESLFLSIQAPTEGSLRWEISQLALKA